jgi:hypothetical protein
MCLLNIIYNENDCFLLQNNLTKVYQFCCDNSLKLNPSKCEVLRITFKNINNFNYKVNDILLNNVITHKHVGVIYDCKMTFNAHFDCIIENSLKKFAILRVLCKRVNGLTFLRLYLTYILPILEFCNLSVIPNKTQSNRLELVQRKITKYMF